MTETEHQSYNALSTWLHADYRKLAALIKQHGSWLNAYKQNKKEIDDALNLWEKVEQAGISLVLQSDAEFPEMLREIPWTPHGLYILGAPLNSEMKVAIVGTRKATTSGLDVAQRFSKELAQAQLTIVSGLALGVDAAAHEGVLLAKGKTIAVLACGLDSIYPRQHAGLAQRIIKGGGSIVSEYPPSSPALQQRFLERNRITSGLAHATLVIESPLKSGVRSTARFAIEQNREVFVIPGSITHPNYAGSHELIRSGATLVTKTAEILEHLEIKPKTNQTLFTEGAFDKLEKKHRIILQALHENGMPLSADELATMTTMTTPEVSETLTLLIIEGIIKEENGTYFII